MKGSTKKNKQNSITLENELNWLASILKQRFENFLNKKSAELHTHGVPDLTKDDSVYALFLKYYNFSISERIALILTLAPHIRPQILDIFFANNTLIGRNYTEFGGINMQSHSGFIPTGETLSFILQGNNSLNIRFELIKMFDASHVFAVHSILKLDTVKEGEPFLSGVLRLSDEYIELFTLGREIKPNFSSKFPAKLITTKLDWENLVVEENVLHEINNILSWMRYKNIILNEWDLSKRIKSGYKALFYGPPGTGKTFTASLIGKTMNKDVYKIDLSMVVSKWVGETEKNLARIFDAAEHKEWILFFDEADALFGKRTSTQSSQERYANQEVAYLLQRTEDFPGTIILASNMKGNIDEAFSRRFQSIIYFPIPKPKQRLRLWNDYFSNDFELDDEIKFEKIAKEYEITGGAIINVLKYCAIKAAEKNIKQINFEFLIEGIRRELAKEGKLI